MSDWLWTWSAARSNVSCGAEVSCRIQRGEPVLEIRHGEWVPGTRPLVRCQRHWPDRAVPDWDAIRAAEQALAPQSEPVDTATVMARRAQRYQHQPSGFSKFSESSGSLFDAKAAALGRETD